MPQTIYDSSLTFPQLSREERFESALARLRSRTNRSSIRFIASRFGLPRSTLQDRLYGHPSLIEAHENLQKLSVEEEKSLKRYVQKLQAWGWPGAPEHIRYMATHLLRQKGDYRHLGVHWGEKFLSRHPELKTKYIPPLDKARASAETVPIIQGWFDLYENQLKEHGIFVDDVWNMDEKGILMGLVQKRRVIIDRRYRATQIQPGDREQATIIECVGLTGKSLPPWVIFKAKRQKQAWHDAVKPHVANICISDNGWTDNELGLRWLKECFEPHTKQLMRGNFRMLIMDGHASHISAEAVEFCISNNILLACLPAHTTHLLQPLDVGIFSPLAKAYSDGIIDFSQLGGVYAIDKVDFLKVLMPAREKAITSSNIQKAFAASGLHPFQPQVVLEKLPKQLDLIANESWEVRIRPLTPPDQSGTIVEGAPGFHGPGGFEECFKTPVNALEFHRLVDEYKRGDKHCGPVFEKLIKTAESALANLTIASKTNEVLIAQSKRHHEKATRSKAQLGEARVMNAEVLEERRARALEQRLNKLQAMINKQCQKELTGLMKLPVWLIGEPPKTPYEQRKHTRRLLVKLYLGKEALLAWSKRKFSPIERQKKVEQVEQCNAGANTTFSSHGRQIERTTKARDQAR